MFPPADRAEIAAAVTEILASGALTLGPYTGRFEAAFAAAHDAAHAVATSSGTSALNIALQVAGVAGRDVVVPANTFYATAAAVVHVHIGGMISPDVIGLRELCDERGIALVEDAAHAHGSTLDGRFAGSFGASGAFSFYPTKVVTSGEGGMLVSASEHVEEEAKIYRDQGKGAFTANHHVRLGSAWRMSELHAVTGLVHLRRMEEFISRRREVAAAYDKALGVMDGLTPLAEAPGSRGNVYKYIVLLPPGTDRAAVKQELRDRFGVRLSGEVYDLPLNHQPVLAEYAGPSLPVAEDIAARHICLPVHSDMSDAEVDEVLTAITAVHETLPGG